ncbi:neocarzinostatin apoprotein domain-containing protein [Catellatospora sp. TT07R-123]|uniref:neocarzinostatin apoprotein domain-containing protein n=1 Tax=Catellatospora sp. TT07R-123 TaxID=2733863 RepID=UPI001BB3C1DC|nr:neocarzinostatin apoprotein domain-containing protein [Catellatospora sp. TT07R-123]
MKPVSLLSVLVLVAAGSLVASSPAVALDGPPAAHVTPRFGLSTASTVTVSGSGLPAHTEVAVVECDVETYDTGDGLVGCPAVRTVTTSATGTASVQLNPRDPVYRSLEYGDPVPVYCRADACRYFFEWTDSAGLHSVGTDVLHFTGSPATITATPAAGLADGQRVKVTGTAKGSTGRYVTIVEASCFQIIQGSGCNGNLPLATVPLRADGTFRATVTVFRYLGDGQDCVGDFYGCQLHVVVLGPDGRPDDTFGVSSIGQPAVPLEFAP